MMAETDSYLDPRAIVVKREARQRMDASQIDDLKQSIQRIGVINPIVVRREDDVPVLIAGERRLRSCLELNLQQIPVRYFDDLSDEEVQLVELEENVKRQELPWRDHVKAVGRIHALYTQINENWSIEKTAKEISLHHTQLRKILHVHAALGSAKLANATSVEQAFSALQRFAERKAESIVSDIIAKGASAFAEGNGELITAGGIAMAEDQPPPTQSVSAEAKLNGNFDKAFAAVKQVIVPPPSPVLCTDFAEWVQTYSGPKFTFLHCDFPYGNYEGKYGVGVEHTTAQHNSFYASTEDIYFSLLETLIQNIDRIASYSAHIMFWFSMNFYTETVQRLRQGGLTVVPRPLVWHKSDNSGVIPVGEPRNTYETALLAIRGSRPIVKPIANSYAAPTASGSERIHLSQKPEPVLRHFFRLFVDETTLLLDPTCGSGTALRVAEELGAKSVLGLELNEEFAVAANNATLKARVLRKAH